MKYAIVIEKPAEKFIGKLPKPEKERLLKAIYQLPDGNDIKTKIAATIRSSDD